MSAKVHEKNVNKKHREKKRGKKQMDRIGKGIKEGKKTKGKRNWVNKYVKKENVEQCGERKKVKEKKKKASYEEC